MPEDAPNQQEVNGNGGGVVRGSSGGLRELHMLHNFSRDELRERRCIKADCGVSGRAWV